MEACRRCLFITKQQDEQQVVEEEEEEDNIKYQPVDHG
jgi:hypothetical protein